MANCDNTAHSHRSAVVAACVKGRAARPAFFIGARPEQLAGEVASAGDRAACDLRAG